MRGLSLDKNKFTAQVSLEHLPDGLQSLSVSTNQLSADPTEGHLSVVGWTSTPVLGEAKNLLNPSLCFCFGADPIDGRRKVVGQHEYPSIGRIRKPPLVAMVDPGSSRWRDERRSTHSLWIKARNAMSPHEYR
ncbi:hypothetical protein XU18_3082 [Perkinsela sp. CCAP 1560/4]|nr:hypothetical protein XU18_3082 [Perkinsela sp. CCAP 1560/4]|eukprot:KNH05988.1 hypothetical protein XU18_3082 [Perkinsela sp. CCAP 1560/4]